MPHHNEAEYTDAVATTPLLFGGLAEWAGVHIRMYGRNPNLLVHHLIAWQTRGDHVCVKSENARHVGALRGDSSPKSLALSHLHGRI